MECSYIYKITHKPTGLYYIGARYTKRLSKPPEEDFLHDYFTTSNRMKRLLFLHSPDDFEWELTPWPRETIKEEEQRLLNESADDPLCLYKHPKKLWKDPEYAEKVIEGNKRAHRKNKQKYIDAQNKPETVTLKSNNSKKLWEDPTYRAKQMADRAKRKTWTKHNWTRRNGKSR